MRLNVRSRRLTVSSSDSASVGWFFKQLYVSGEKRIALLNEKAPGFFAHLQPIWLDGVVLGVTRLLDPAQM
jgi:hypothetical protein